MGMTLEEKLEQLIKSRDGDSSYLDEKLTPKELAHLWKKELVEFLKDNLYVSVDSEPTDSCMGYDLFATVSLENELLKEATNFI